MLCVLSNEYICCYSGRSQLDLMVSGGRKFIVPEKRRIQTQLLDLKAKSLVPPNLKETFDLQ